MKAIESIVKYDPKTSGTILEYTTIIMVENAPIIESVIRFDLDKEEQFIYHINLDITFS